MLAQGEPASLGLGVVGCEHWLYENGNFLPGRVLTAFVAALLAAVIMGIVC